MTLARYREKRKFTQTPEPTGRKESSAGQLKFVVQKHHSSHLHYDFRLELDGVLKSWAVPKGPSLDPSVKRLAMMVEDHPLSYMRFEGAIPPGNYGAGEVIVWDIGDYFDNPAATREANEQAMRAGLKKGHLSFELRGMKLRGRFDLIKMHGREANAWLLVKKEDAHASDADLTKLDKSVISAKRLPDPSAAGVPARRSSASRKEASATRVKLQPHDEEEAGQPKKKPAGRNARATGKAKVPYPIKPMLCTLVDQPFDGADWLFEVKWDGYRAIGQVDGRQVHLYSRNANSFADDYPTVFDALPQLGHDCVLDGEVVALVKAGKSSFQALQNHGNTGTGKIRYVAFDLLFLDGHDLRGLPLVQRKELLEQLIASAPAAARKMLVYSEHTLEHGIRFFETITGKGLEGIIAKRAGSTYKSTRGRDWLKIKAHLRQEAVIAGFTAPRGSRKKFGALILGVYDGDELRYIGHTGTGFTDSKLAGLSKRLRPLVTAKSPFKKAPKTNQPATWVKPRLLCEIEFTEWTGEGHMRHPVFVGLRDDKPPTQVHAEEVKPVEAVAGTEIEVAKAQVGPRRAPAAKSGKTTPADSRTAARPSTAKVIKKDAAGMHAGPTGISTKAKLTNPDKLYWPGEGITKGDMLAYYAAVADWMLPYIKNRPLSLNRYPAGIEGHSFFQKDVDFKVPSFMKTADIYSESNAEDITWLVANNRDSLLYVANLGSIEINPWNSRVGKLDKPDYTVVDLDPDANTFDEVVALAQQTRKLLDKLGVEGYCKTSGKTGLHIYIPLGAKYTYEQAKEFTHILARLLHAQSPDNTSLERSPAKRKGLVYLDYLQNRTGQTLAAPYSVRPAPGAPVSTPLKWSEVKKGLDPRKFTIFNTLKRLEKVGDMWAPVLGPGVDLKAVLKKLGG